MKTLKILALSVLLAGSTMIMSKDNGDYYNDGKKHEHGVLDFTSASYKQGYQQGLIDGLITDAGDINKLSTAQIALLSGDMIVLLTAAQIIALTQPQIAALTFDQLATICSNKKAFFRNLSPAQQAFVMDTSILQKLAAKGL